MGRIVVTLDVVGDSRVLGDWCFNNVEEAIRKIDELWNTYSRRYKCTRYNELSFECNAKGGVLRAVWLPESMDDLEQLIQHVASQIEHNDG